MRDIKTVVFNYRDNKCFHIGYLINNFMNGFSIDKKYGKGVACFEVCDDGSLLKCSMKFFGEKRLVKVSMGYNCRFLLLNRVPELLGDVYFRREDSGILVLSSKPYGVKLDVDDGVWGKQINFDVGVYSGLYYVFNVDGNIVMVPEYSKNFIFAFCNRKHVRFIIDSIYDDVVEKIKDFSGLVDVATFLYDDVDYSWFGLKKVKTSVP